MIKVFEGRKGNYTILRKSAKELFVEYLSGPWSGKKKTMSIATHNRIQENLEIEGLGKKLDQWWDQHPTLYERHWREGISGPELLKTLEVNYPKESIC